MDEERLKALRLITLLTVGVKADKIETYPSKYYVDRKSFLLQTKAHDLSARVSYGGGDISASQYSLCSPAITINAARAGDFAYSELSCLYEACLSKHNDRTSITVDDAIFLVEESLKDA